MRVTTRTAYTLIGMATLLATGCAEPSGPAALDSASFAISDGANSGNEHFYFLPPMVPEPTYSGTFDGSLAPDVTICLWDEAAGLCVGGAVAEFTMTAGSGSEIVRVNPDEESYQVNWNTDGLLGEGDTYRITVSVAGQSLGFADVRVVESGRELRNVETNEYVPLKDGRTLPIIFRIEDGAIGPPQPVTGPMVSAGGYHTCALAPDGQAFCWGNNVDGALGDGTNTSSNVPVAVAGGSTWTTISAGVSHTCGITTAGEAYCWGAAGGRGTIGQLGDGSGLSQNAPTLVAGGHLWTSIGAGEAHTCGTTTSGDAYCWGVGGGTGGLGSGDLATDASLVPQLVVGGHNFTSANAGRSYSCGVTAAPDHLVYCWGLSVPNIGPVPTLLTPSIQFEMVSTGTAYACGVERGTGQGFCWGYDFWGTHGNGNPTDHGNPLPVLGDPLRMIDAGNEHSCSASLAGQGYCFGKNDFGQIGDGNVLVFPNRQATPAQVLNHDFSWVSSGGRSHSCGITTPGTEVWCWGANSFGELGDGSNTNSAVPVFALDLMP